MFHSARDSSRRAHAAHDSQVVELLPSPSNVLLLLLWVGLAIGVSFLCSLLEAVLLAVRTTALTARRDTGGGRGAALLLGIKRERLDDAISAILTLNTISHTIGAALAGAQAARLAHDYGYGHRETLVVGVFSAVLTLLILALSEIVPKTLGAAYAVPLSGFVGRTLDLLMRLLAPALFFTSGLTRLLTPARRSGVSRGEVRAFLKMATGAGALRDHEAGWHASLLALDGIRVAEVLTPRTALHMLPEGATVGDLVDDDSLRPFGRIPLFRGDRDHVTGYVYVRDVLRAAARGAPREGPLASHVRPVFFVPEMATVGDALHELLRRDAPFAMVADEHGGVAGLVSLEDLIETAFGAEVTDEADEVADLRRAALRRREARLAHPGGHGREPPPGAD